MEKVLITGGSGLIGTHLTFLLKAEGYDVAHINRYGSSLTRVKNYKWQPSRRKMDESALNDVDYIIHLAGANIATRWSAKKKRAIVKSRVDSANLLYKEVKEREVKLKGFISSGGINYYGASNSEQVHVEEDVAGDDFIGICCQQWEAAANQFRDRTRVVIFRTGAVLDNQYGFLSKMAAPMEFGVGAPIGSGDQYVPWIHIDDIARMYLHALKNKKVEGTYNAVAPFHVTNQELTQELAGALGRKILAPNVPSFAIKARFGNEFAQVILEGRRASCQKIMDTGFEFKYDTAEKAVNNLFTNEN